MKTRKVFAEKQLDRLDALAWLCYSCELIWSRAFSNESFKAFEAYIAARPAHRPPLGGTRRPNVNFMKTSRFTCFLYKLFCHLNHDLSVVDIEKGSSLGLALFRCLLKYRNRVTTRFDVMDFTFTGTSEFFCILFLTDFLLFLWIHSCPQKQLFSASPVDTNLQTIK